MHDFSEPMHDFSWDMHDFFEVVRGFFEPMRGFSTLAIFLFKKFFLTLYCKKLLSINL